MTRSDEWTVAYVEAEIFMLPEERNSRSKGIQSGYRPNHNFGDEKNNEMRMGEMSIQDDQLIMFGETKTATVKFVFPEGYNIDLYPGLTWRIQEGINWIATGKVTRVFESQPGD